MQLIKNKNKVFLEDLKNKFRSMIFFNRRDTARKMIECSRINYSKNYLIREVVGNFFGWVFGVFAVARTVKGIPLSIGTPPNSPLISKT